MLPIGTAAAPTQVTYRVAEDTTQNYHVEGLPFGTRGGLAIEHTFPSDGKYTFKVFSVNLGNMGNFRPFGEIRGEQLLVYVDGERVRRWTGTRRSAWTAASTRKARASSRRST